MIFNRIFLQSFGEFLEKISNKQKLRIKKLSHGIFSYNHFLLFAYLNDKNLPVDARRISILIGTFRENIIKRKNYSKF